MGNFILFLTCVTSLVLIVSGSCLFDHPSLCPGTNPLIFGGRLQSLTTDGSLVDPLWNIGRRVFVFQYPQRTEGRWSQRPLKGPRGFIHIGQKSCSGSGPTVCPMNRMDLPCTSDDAPFTYPSGQFVFSNITSNSVHVSWYFWDITARARLPDIYGYTLQYREVGGEFQNVTKVTSQSETIRNLQADTEYQFRLVPFTINPDDVIAPTRSQTVRTLCGVPTQPWIYFNSTTSRTAYFDVHIPYPAQWMCRNITLHLQEEVEDVWKSVEEWKNVEELDPSNTEVEVVDLLPCSRHKYRLQLSNNVETVISATTVGITTNHKAHGPVQDVTLVADPSYPGTLNITWLPPDMNDTLCPVIHYNVRYAFMKYLACSEEGLGFFGEAELVPGSETILTNLEDYATYNVSVTPVVEGVHQSGYIEGTTIYIVGSTATNNPSSAPIDVLLTGISLTYLKFSWKPPVCELQNGVLTGYTYILKQDGIDAGNSSDNALGDIRTGFTDKVYVDFKNLEEDTTYSFQVRAMTSYGHGPYSKPVVESTRYRACPGKLRLGGTLISSDGVRPPWGGGQPIFVLPHRSKRRFFGAGVGRIWIGSGRSCPSPSGGCSPGVNNPVPINRLCSGGRNEASTCDAACPSFSREVREFLWAEGKTISTILLTWREWDVRIDRGSGPISGYMIRYSAQGDDVALEIQKGLSLHHVFYNTTLNTDYEFEVIPMKSGINGGSAICTGPANAQLVHTTGCGKLRPVSNLNVRDGSDKGELRVSWSPPIDRLCPVEYYNITYSLVELKACADSESIYETSSPTFPQITNMTEFTLWGLEDYAEYTINVTPYTAKLVGEGHRYGETAMFTVTTAEYAPIGVPANIILPRDMPTSISISWEKPYCAFMNGEFTMYSYFFTQNGRSYNGTTEEDHVEFENLVAFSDYTFKVRVHTIGPGPYNTKAGTTQPSTPLGYVNSSYVINLLNVTATSIVVSWPKWDENVGTGSGTVVFYVLDIVEVGREYIAGVPFMSDWELIHQADFLKEDTDYAFQVTIVAKGEFDIPGDKSHQQVFRTRCGVPAEASVQLLYQTVTSTSALLQMLNNISSSPDLWKCDRIVVHLQKNILGEWQDIAEIDPAVLYVEVKDLRPCTENYFRVRIANKHESSYSEVVEITTYSQDIGPVQNLNAVATDNNGELYVTWSPPNITNECTVSWYEVTYSYIGSAACIDNVFSEGEVYPHNLTEVILPNLEQYSKYLIQIRPLVLHGRGSHGELRDTVGTTKPVPPSGIIVPELVENSTSERSLKFAWEGLNCKEYNGRAFSYACYIYETNSGRSILTDSQNVISETCTFSNLRACGEYSFEVMPVNEEYQGEVSFPINTTISSAALGAVYNISAVPHYNGSVTIKWMSPDTTSNLCPVRGFKVGYMLQRHQACHMCVDQELPPLLANDTSLLLKNLAPFSTFKINISVATDDENSYGQVLTEKVFTSKMAAPSIPPRVWLDASKTTSHSLTFKWLSITCTSLNGMFRQYTFRGNATTGESGISSRKVRSYTIRHLTPCTTYSFDISVVNTVGRGPFGTSSGTTSLGRPGSNFNLTVSATSNGDIVATWQTSDENPCYIDDFIISVHLKFGPACENDESPAAVTEVLRSSTTSFTFYKYNHSLKANSEYEVTLRAVNEIGESEKDVKRLNTPELAPSAGPSRIHVLTSVSPMKLYWTNVDCQHANGIIKNYFTILQRGDEVVSQQNTTEKFIAVKDLSSGTYTFRVKAKTSGGYGPFKERTFRYTE